MNDTQQAPPTERPNPGHETQDANIRFLALAGAALLIITVAALFVTWGFLTVLTNRQITREVQLPPLADTQQLSPEPRLQDSPQQDLSTQRQAEDTLLNGYGWLNQEAGVVRIPIERAIDLTAERGLPVRETENRSE